MLNEGYAAVTVRRIASEVGVTAPLIHYYFGPMDDVFIAVLRRRAGEGLLRQASLMSGPQPLTALWEFSFATASVRYTTEFMALAHHREAVRVELLTVIRLFSESAVSCLKEAESSDRINLGGADPAGVVATLMNSARGIAMQRVLGFTDGHEEAVRIVKRLIARLESQPAAVGTQFRASPPTLAR
jgi:AcrR family transcriptional regulator